MLKHHTGSRDTYQSQQGWGIVRGIPYLQNLDARQKVLCLMFSFVCASIFCCLFEGMYASCSVLLESNASWPKASCNTSTAADAVL